MNYNNIKMILENWQDFDWSLQGFGMLRCRLHENIRIHVWSHKLATENVSIMHTHPWDFTSTVVSGHILNIIYQGPSSYRGKRFFVAKDKEELKFVTFIKRNRVEIITGTDGKIISEPVEIKLREYKRQIYVSGESYRMNKEWIHESYPSDGCVSIMIKEPTTEDTAYSYYPVGEEWVSAKPRPATFAEIEVGVDKALRCWKYSRQETTPTI